MRRKKELDSPIHKFLYQRTCCDRVNSILMGVGIKHMIVGEGLVGADQYLRLVGYIRKTFCAVGKLLLLCQWSDT